MHMATLASTANTVARRRVLAPVSDHHNIDDTSRIAMIILVGGCWIGTSVPQGLEFGTQLAKSVLLVVPKVERD